MDELDDATVSTLRDEQALDILLVLPSLFPSTSAPPKRVRDASEALLHVLEETEDPNSYLKKRSLS